MKSMYEIKEDLKKLLGIPHDKYLAEDLGIQYHNLRNRVIRNSIPFKEILELCFHKNIDALNLFYGDK